VTNPLALGPLLHGLTVLAFILHIGGGAIGLASGTVAALARKGGALHRKAGNIFVVSMLVMGVFAIYLAVVEPDQITNVFIGILAIYLVSTAWMAVHRKEGARAAYSKRSPWSLRCALLSKVQMPDQRDLDEVISPLKTRMHCREMPKSCSYRRMRRASVSVTSETAVPFAPARAVRPTLCR
jgi:uncharacterized membrane protein